jgi:hypothetical protein
MVWAWSFSSARGGKEEEEEADEGVEDDMPARPGRAPTAITTAASARVWANEYMNTLL